MNKGSGSVAKNPKIEAKFQFHIKEYKKAEYLSDNIQIQATIPNNWFITLTPPFIGNK